MVDPVCRWDAHGADAPPPWNTLNALDVKEIENTKWYRDNILFSKFPREENLIFIEEIEI
jgi:hypothetical protein